VTNERRALFRGRAVLFCLVQAGEASAHAFVSARGVRETQPVPPKSMQLPVSLGYWRALHFRLALQRPVEQSSFVSHGAPAAIFGMHVLRQRSVSSQGSSRLQGWLAFCFAVQTRIPSRAWQKKPFPQVSPGLAHG